MRSRFALGETYSALLVDAHVVGLNTSLVYEANDHGCEIILIGELPEQQCVDLGVIAQLPQNFEHEDLVALLQTHAKALDITASLASLNNSESSTTWQGSFISVTGIGGSGASLLAVALAQGLASKASNQGLVLLADLALNADQAVIHDSRDIIPGLQELVESCHAGWQGHDRLRHLFFEPVGRGYHLLLGLRRHLDWTTIKQRPLEIALNGLIRTYRFVVADTDADLEGQSDTGSNDIEERNRLARSAIGRSDLVVVVGAADMLSLHALVRTIFCLVNKGVSCDRLLPVINQVSKSPRIRSSLKTTLAEMLDNTDAQNTPEPVFVPAHRGVESTLRDGIRLPAFLCQLLSASVATQLAHLKCQNQS